MATVTRYGREFNFDDGVSPDDQQTRINNWMSMHAPDELKSGATAAETPTSTPTPTPTPQAGGTSHYNPKLAMIARTLMAPTPLGGLAMLPGVGQAINKRIGDPDFYRTLAQGALPASDEAIAGVRSVLPGGPQYSDALSDERQHLKDYGDRVGGVEKALTELGGAAATIPLTAGAGELLQGTRLAGMAGNALSKLPGVARAGEFALAHPHWARLIGTSAQGAGLGAASGYMAGEGEENRAKNAGYMGAIGAVLGPAAYGATKGTESLFNTFSKNSRVADFLRNRLVQDRADAYLNRPGVVRNKITGEIDTSHPGFANMSADELQEALQRQRTKSMDIAGVGNPGGKDVLTADVLPGTTESVLLHQTPGGADLNRAIVKRQFNPELPVDQQADASQFGQVKKWFDRTMGPDAFRGEEADILARRSAGANAAYAAPYRQHVWTPEIEAAYDKAKILRPDVVEQAERNAAAEGRSTGTFGATGGPREGERLNYNIQYLHDIKRMLDKPLNDKITFDKAPILTVKNSLNDAMGVASPGYAAANKEYGHHSELLDALRAGRENIFGRNVNEIDKGMGREDIDAFLNDPNNSNAAKDMFRIGGARALRDKLLGSDSRTFTSNWANTLSNPNMMEKYQALLPPGRQQEWPHMVDQIRQLSDRQKMMGAALGNSKTVARQQRVEEMNTPSVLAQMVATGVNPHAPSAAKNWVQMILNRNMAGRTTANEVSRLLNMSGPAGNNAAVQKIRDLLSQYQGRDQFFNTMARGAARVAPYYGMPGRQYTPQPSSQNSSRQP